MHFLVRGICYFYLEYGELLRPGTWKWNVVRGSYYVEALPLAALRAGRHRTRGRLDPGTWTLERGVWSGWRKRVFCEIFLWTHVLYLPLDGAAAQAAHNAQRILHLDCERFNGDPHNTKAKRTWHA